ncbi:hypothetical protein PHSC3_001874 [Chlamydiales bacterium STE3]|nr:hypothetical protein PHSC3_001874 [Chlamydiales bacterium STE3]
MKLSYPVYLSAIPDKPDQFAGKEFLTKLLIPTIEREKEYLEQAHQRVGCNLKAILLHGTNSVGTINKEKKIFIEFSEAFQLRYCSRICSSP